MSSLDPKQQSFLFSMLQRQIDENFWKVLTEFSATGLWKGKEVTIAPVKSPLNMNLRLQAKALLLSPLEPEVQEAQERALLSLLTEPNAPARQLAAEVLGEKRVTKAIPLLMGMLEKGSPEDIVAAINALGKIKAIEAITLLAEFMEHPDKDIHRAAADALGEIGAASLEVLRKAAAHDNDHIRWHAAKTLQKIRDERTVPILISLLDDPNYGVRWLAIEGLISLGEGVLPYLLRALQEQEANTWFRESALHVIENVTGPATKRELQDLIESLKHPETALNVPLHAHKALEKLSTRELPPIKVEKKELPEPPRFAPASVFPVGQTEEMASILHILELKPYRCHHCGGASPTENPSPADRCPYCGYHLRTCYNCVYYERSGCLLNQPYVISSAIPGNRCPYFKFRKTRLPLSGKES
jgi:HEAT repeat protein